MVRVASAAALVAWPEGNPMAVSVGTSPPSGRGRATLMRNSAQQLNTVAIATRSAAASRRRRRQASIAAPATPTTLSRGPAPNQVTTDQNEAPRPMVSAQLVSAVVTV
jgi:hypothetical protein